MVTIGYVRVSPDTVYIAGAVCTTPRKNSCLCSVFWVSTVCFQPVNHVISIIVLRSKVLSDNATYDLPPAKIISQYPTTGFDTLLDLREYSDSRNVPYSASQPDLKRRQRGTSRSPQCATCTHMMYRTRCQYAMRFLTSTDTVQYSMNRTNQRFHSSGYWYSVIKNVGTNVSRNASSIFDQTLPCSIQ